MKQHGFVLGLVSLAFVLLSVAPASAADQSEPAGLRYSQDADPTFVNTDEGQRVLFSRSTDGLDGTGPERLMTVTDDGSSPAVLTDPSLGNAHLPAGTIFGNQVAYVTGFNSGREDAALCLLRPVGVIGGVCSMLTSNEGWSDPALSTTGDAMAAIQGVHLKVIDISPSFMVGINYVSLPDLPEASEPTFSRDGDRVFFTGKGSKAGNSQAGIWSVAANGSGSGKRLTGTNSTIPCYVDSSPVWQPFRDQVVFLRNALACGDPDMAGVWSIDPDSAWDNADWPQGEQIAAGTSEDIAFSDLTVSRDGTKIAWSRSFPNFVDSTDAVVEVYANLEVTEVSSPDTETSFDSHPSFSSDGNQLVFLRNADAPGEPADTRLSGIYRVDSDGFDQVQLTESFNYQQEACCPPPEVPKMKVKVTPASVKIRADRPKFFKVNVTRTGDGAARKLKLCASFPKVLRVGRKCQSIGGLSDGSVYSLMDSVTLKKDLRGSHRYKVKYRLTGQGLKTAADTLVVRTK